MEPREELRFARLFERGTELSELAHEDYFRRNGRTGDGYRGSHPPEEFLDVHHCGPLGSDQAEQTAEDAHDSEHDRTPREHEESTCGAALREAEGDAGDHESDDKQQCAMAYLLHRAGTNGGGITADGGVHHELRVFRG